MALLSSKDKSVPLKSEERPTTSLRMDKAEQSMEAVEKKINSTATAQFGLVMKTTVMKILI